MRQRTLGLRAEGGDRLYEAGSRTPFGHGPCLVLRITIAIGFLSSLPLDAEAGPGLRTSGNLTSGNDGHLVMLGAGGSGGPGLPGGNACEGNYPPIVTIENPYSDMEIEVGETVTFLGTVTDEDEDDFVLGWYVSFEGSDPPGTAGTDESMDYTFTQAGHYQVSLKAFDRCDIGAAAVNITAVEPDPVEGLVADFEIQQYRWQGDEVGWYPLADGSQVELGLELRFDGTPSNDALYYMWYFGDGGQNSDITSPIAHHAYEQAGQYLVRLTVFDSSGMNYAEAEQTVVISEGMEWLDTAPGPDSGFSLKTGAESGELIWLCSTNGELAFVDTQLSPLGTIQVAATDVNPPYAMSATEDHIFLAQLSLGVEVRSAEPLPNQAVSLLQVSQAELDGEPAAAVASHGGYLYIGGGLGGQLHVFEVTLDNVNPDLVSVQFVTRMSVGNGVWKLYADHLRDALIVVSNDSTVSTMDLGASDGVPILRDSFVATGGFRDLVIQQEYFAVRHGSQASFYGLDQDLNALLLSNIANICGSPMTITAGRMYLLDINAFVLRKYDVTDPASMTPYFMEERIVAGADPRLLFQQNTADAARVFVGFEGTVDSYGQ